MEKSSTPSVNTHPEVGGASSRFSCLECQRSFGRVEHLTRHSRSHMQDRYLKCPVCQKGFYRIDALRRHEQTHNEPRRSALIKGSRACIACAAARRKCSGETICSSCQKRSLECRYPATVRTRRAPTNGKPPTDTDIMSPGAFHTTQSEEGQNVSNTGDSPMSWSHTSNSPTINTTREGIQTSSPTPLAVGDSTQEPTPFSSYGNAFVQQGPRRQAMSPEVPDANAPSSQGQRTEEEERLHMSETPLQNVQRSQIMAADSNMSLNSANTPTTWFQSNFSSINWLPEDWTPDFDIHGSSLDTFGQQQILMFDNNMHSNLPAIGNAIHDSSPMQHMPPNLRRVDHPPMTITAQGIDGQDFSSPGSQSTQSGGRFYVDGDGARLPRVRKAPYRHSDSYSHSLEFCHKSTRPVFGFLESDEYQNDSDSSIDTIPANVYSEIFRMFSLTCLSSTHYPHFQGNSLPSLYMLSRFIHNYTQNFRPILPFTHPSTFDVSATHWLLTLSMATIGSHYSDYSGAESTTIALHEFLRRAILSVVETGANAKPDVLALTQVKLLSCIGMMYSGDERLKSLAGNTRSDLVSFCESSWRELSTYTSSSSDSADVEWKLWCQAESSRRTGYCIWLLDCMWNFHFQTRPLLTLDDASVPIPCQEVLWEADSAMDWRQLYSCATPSPCLHSVIQLAYVEKRIQSSTGEFSRILCIHALFRRTWEVENCFKQPLTLWTPTAEKQNIENIERSVPIWLPGVSTYAKWRNSACDCLDILHWHANSIIGAASGMEHPTVLHLHLARVILLTPHREILRFAELVSTEGQPNQEINSLRKYIQRWALEDQHKARLAMIHAGVLFWHVRRFAVDAFYEPSSVLLATLALWAYGSFATPTSGVNAQKEGESPQTEDDDAESLFPTSIQLDRPADDELVQLFVKRGAVMKANITGVGNLCSAKGPRRVLIEGRNLLAGLKNWGSSQQATRTLNALIEYLRTDI